MKKIFLSVFFLLFSFSFLLTSCDKTQPDPPDDTGKETSGETGTEKTPEEGFPLTEGTVAVRNGADAALTARLTAALKEAGVTVDPESTGRAVLIGGDDPDSLAVAAGLNDGQYAIAVRNGNLILTGKDGTQTEAAVTGFILKYLKTDASASLPEGHTETGTFTVPGEYRAVKAENGTAARPVLVSTVYPTEEPVIADIIATEDYQIDPTGKKDCTAELQKALNACASKGGGTVFLPAGSYLVTSNVNIPSGVTLYGDWQDPDTADVPTYGTVILAKPKSKLTKNAKRNASVLFTLNQHSGAIGLTVYYPDQKPDKIKEYGYTFHVGNALTATISNVTLINSYRGIGVNAGAEGHELMELSHVRICALETALEMHRSSDVGYSYDVKISPSYWAAAGCGYDCEKVSVLRDVCRTSATGIILGDLDDETLSEIRVEGYATGILMKTITERSGFWGVIYDMDITKCGIGIDIESFDRGNGALIANARIEGTEYAIRNRVETMPLRLADCKLTGKAEGYLITEDDSLAAYPVVHGSFVKPAEKLYVCDILSLKAKTQDIGPAVQAILDEAGKTGGVVWIPAGVYSLYTPLTVPANVLLRGSQSIFTRDGDANAPGTVLLTYVNEGAAITLGENAGVSGFRVWYPSYDPGTALEKPRTSDAAALSCTAIKGNGKGVYAFKTVVNAAFVGFDFTGCDDHLIRTCLGCCYLNFTRTGGKNGTVEECLANPNFIQRRTLDSRFDPAYADKTTWNRFHQGEAITEPGFALLRDDLLREYCVAFRVEDAENQNLLNVFMYGARTLVGTERSSALVINGTQDYLKGTNPMFEIRNSKVAAINALRIFGISLINENSELDIYNRNDRNCVTERPYHSSVEFEDHGTDVIVTEVIPLNACESSTGLRVASVTKNAELVHEGKSSWAHLGNSGVSVIFEWTFDPLDLTDYVRDGYLHLWVYVKGNTGELSGQIELTSSGQCDVEEAGWMVGSGSFLTGEGWHELFLPLKNYSPTGGGPDFSAINYMRFYLAGCEKTDIAVDDISIALA